MGRPRCSTRAGASHARSTGWNVTDPATRVAVAHARATERYDGRVIRAGAVTLVAALCAACVSAGTTECPDKTLCSDGRSCVAVPDGAYQCASDEQLAACKRVDDGAVCSVGVDHGTCFGGGCIITACGDGVQDADPMLEACDDGNTLAGDGCSADCTSSETCGNGITDLAAGEECDDGGTTLSGDGCTSRCKREYRLWRDVTPRSPSTRQGFGFVTDPMHATTLIGGGVTTFDGTSTVTTVFDDTWRWDGTSWIQAAPPVAQNARFDAAFAYDARRRRVVMFGGFGNAGMSSQNTWEWDGVTWTDRSSVSGPDPRSGAAMACNLSECVMFGGITSTVTNETWAWNGIAWAKRTIVSPPPARTKAAMVYDALGDQIIMYSGIDAGVLADIWIFKNNTWTLMGIGPGTPGASLAFDPIRGKVILVDAIRTSTLDTATWTFSELTGTPLSMNNAHIAWNADALRLEAVGTAITANELAMATLSGMGVWGAASDTRPLAGANRTPAAYDPRRGTTLVLDAATGTFEWTGRGWISRGTANGNGREGTSLAHDPTCGVTLSFGGGPISLAGTRVNDVARFPDAMAKPVWVKLDLVGALPAPRTHHAMAYDPVRKVFVVFGGYIGGAGVYARDTWELASTNCSTWTWTERTPANGPPARHDAQLAYDPVREVMVLFGGRIDTGSSSTAFGDSWEWNGTTWTQRTPAASPAARFSHGMAIDPRRQRIVLYGGRAEGSNFADTWEWDGSTWVLLSPAVLPSARQGMGFAPDITGGLVAINGTGNNAAFGVQRLSSELSTDRVDACQYASLDSDGDGLKGCADPDCRGRCTLVGNSACDVSEDYLLCPADCMAPPP